jgi:biopolymer transport protein ExbB/TolQ
VRDGEAMSWPSFFSGMFASYAIPIVVVLGLVLIDYLTTRRREAKAWRKRWKQPAAVAALVESYDAHQQAMWEAKVAERKERERVRAIRARDEEIGEDDFAGETRRAIKQAIVMLEAGV